MTQEHWVWLMWGGLVTSSAIIVLRQRHFWVLVMWLFAAIMEGTMGVINEQMQPWFWR